MVPVLGSIANAIYDAIGVRMTELPITPERVLKALAEKRMGATYPIAALADNATMRYVAPLTTISRYEWGRCRCRDRWGSSNIGFRRVTTGGTEGEDSARKFGHRRGGWDGR